MCKVDGRILTLRAIYFFQTAAASSILRFLIVFLKKYYNATQIGFLLGIRPGVGFFASALWGYIGDCTRKHLFCLIFGLIMAVVTINGLIISKIGQNFWFAMINLNIVTLFGASGSLFDAIVLIILGGKHGAGTKTYGATRLWGAVGWGLGSVICGALINFFGEQFIFWFYDSTYSISIIIMIISSSYLSIHKHDNNNNEIIKEKESDSKNKKSELDIEKFKQNVFTLHGFIFFINLIIFGTCMGFVANYLFLFLLNEFNATTFLCGLTIGVMVSGEIPIFYFSSFFLSKIGIIGLFTIAHIAYIIRCIAYVLLPETRYYSWFILFIEPLHGLTFAGMWIAAVEYGNKLTTKTMQGTMQGLIQGIYYQLANCFGTILGGWLYQTFGPRDMYKYAAITIFVWAIFFQVSLRLIRYFNPKNRGIRLIFSEKIEQEDIDSLSYKSLVGGSVNNENVDADAANILISCDSDKIKKSQS